MLLWLMMHLVIVGVLAGGVATACRFGRFRPAVCHALWLIVLIKLLVPPVVFWPWSLPVAGLNTESFLTPETWLEFQGQAGRSTASDTGAVRPSEATQDGNAVPGPSAALLDTAAVAFGALWVAGTFVTIGLFAFRLRRFSRIFRTNGPVTGPVKLCADEVAAALGVRPPRLEISPGLGSPVLWGIGRTKVLIPEWALDAPEAALRSMIVHELAHLKRRDHRVGWLELAAASLWWWNPLLWCVRRQLHTYVELACDAWVTSALPEQRQAYAQTLVRAADMQSRRLHTAPVFGMSATSARTFERRLLMVLREHVPCRIPRSALAALCAFLALVLPGWSQETPDAKSAPESGEADTGVLQPKSPTSGADAKPVVPIVEFRVYAAPARIKGFLQNPEEGDRVIGEPARIKGLPVETVESRPVPPESSAVSVRNLFNNPLPEGRISIGSESLEMVDDRLTWNGKTMPASPDVTLASSSWCPLAPGKTATAVVQLPPQWTSRAGQNWTPRLGMMCSQTKPDELNLWLANAHGTEQSVSEISEESVWTKTAVLAPPETWEGMIVDISLPDDYRPPATFLIFWALVTDPNNTSILNRVDRVPFTAWQQKAELPEESLPQYTAEMRFIEAPADELQKALATLESFPVQYAAPDTVKTFRIGDAAEQLDRFLDVIGTLPQSKLVSAPRVTIGLRGDPQKVVWQSSESPARKRAQKDFSDFSESLSAFQKETSPDATIIVGPSEYFEIPGRAEPVLIIGGMAAALKAQPGDSPDSLDVDLYCNLKTVREHRRKWAFWKHAVSPDIRECPIRLKFAYGTGDALCFLSQSTDPGKLLLVTFEMKAAAGPLSQSVIKKD